MKRVIGLGGPFIKATDPQGLANWYAKHLGVPFGENPYAVFTDTAVAGFNIISFFKTDSSYYAPSTKEVMVNFRVENLHALLAVLKEEGVTIAGEPMEEEYGKFGWILDPEGNKVELWEPPAAAE
jgi:predicted enzyme related to lactoylglutathione lyase